MLSLSLERYESCGDYLQHDPEVKPFDDDMVDFATETMVEGQGTPSIKVERGIVAMMKMIGLRKILRERVALRSSPSTKLDRNSSCLF